MRPQDDTTFEAEDQVLAERLDRFERAAVDPLGDALGLRSRMRRVGRDPLADEHLQAACRPVDRVPLGHAATVTGVAEWRREPPSLDRAGAAAAPA